MPTTLEDCEDLAAVWLSLKDDAAPARIDAYVQRGRQFADEPVEWLRILYKQSELNWALGPTTPLMSADGEQAKYQAKEQAKEQADIRRGIRLFASRKAWNHWDFSRDAE